jgi:hypothetical protein
LTTGSPNLLPSGTATTKPQVTALTSAETVLELSYQPTPTVLALRLGGLLKVATVLRLQAMIVRSSLTVTLVAATAAARAPTMELTRGPAVEAIAAAKAMRTAMPPDLHRAAMMPARRKKN